MGAEAGEMGNLGGEGEIAGLRIKRSPRGVCCCCCLHVEFDWDGDASFSSSVDLTYRNDRPDLNPLEVDLRSSAELISTPTNILLSR